MFKEIDYTHFHPLDHWPATRRCRSLPGGTRYHLALAWQYRHRDRIVGWFRRPFCCALGNHYWITWYRREHGGRPRQVMPKCRDCPAERLPSEFEIMQRLPWDE